MDFSACICRLRRKHTHRQQRRNKHELCVFGLQHNHHWRLFRNRPGSTCIHRISSHCAARTPGRKRRFLEIAYCTGEHRKECLDRRRKHYPARCKYRRRRDNRSRKCSDTRYSPIYCCRRKSLPCH